MKFLCFPLDICPANGSVLVIQEMASSITGPQISLSFLLSLSFTHTRRHTQTHAHTHSCLSSVGKSEDTVEKCGGFFFFFLIFQVLVKSVSLTCHPFPTHTPGLGFLCLFPSLPSVAVQFQSSANYDFICLKWTFSAERMCDGLA